MSESTPTQAPPVRTPLYERLKETRARWVDFAGWEMPVEFSGILKEHRTVRTAAGMFDLSHMGELEIRGDIAAAVAFVDSMVSNDVARLVPGQAMYTVVCAPRGIILDDVIVYRFEDHIMLVVNASNREKMVAWFTSHLPPGLELVDRTEALALVALQGPIAESVLAPLTQSDLASLRYYHFTVGAVAGVPCIISRTGYTGEDGFELYVEAPRAIELWDAVAAAGAPLGVTPIGLGARDTLRLEARYALYGNEIDETTNPLEAGLGWVVKLDAADFIGREALRDIKQAGLKRTLVGLQMEDRGVPRHGFEVRHGDEVVGVVTSGTFSPTLEQAIALAYVAKDERRLTAVGTELDIMIRGNACKARVVKTPFHRGSVRS